MADTSAEAFSAWLDSVKAQAWDEGFWDGQRQTGEGDDGPRYTNPYREEEAR